MRSLLAFVKRLFKPTAAQSIRSLLVRSWLGRTSGSLLSRWLRFRRLPIERVERDDARLWARCDSMLLLESRVAPGSVSALAAMPAAMPLVASLGQDRPAFVRASTLERIAAGTTEDRPLLRVATREPRFIRKDDVVEAAPARAASVQQAELAANARFQLSEDPFANPLQDVLGEGREERGSGGLVDGGLEDRASSSAGGGDSYFGTTEQITEAAGGSSGAPLPGDEELALTVQLANAGAFDRFVSLATATSVSGDQVLVIDDLQAFLQGFQQITAPLSPQQGPGTQPPAKLLFPWETPSAADWRFQVRDDDTSRFDVSIGGFEVWISASGTTLAVPQTQGMDTIQKVLALTGQQTATTVITPIVEATFVGAAADAAVTAHGTSEQGAEWLEYHDVFKGIDIIYHSTAQGDLEWSAVVAAGVDPGALVQQFSGASKLEVDAYGNLLIQSSYGTLGYAAPVAFQHIDGKRVEVSSKYVIGAGKTVSFELGAYDASEALIIDPTYYFNGPLPAAGTDEFALPAGVAHAIDIQASPDGSALWVAAQQGNLLLRMDPISGAITGQYAVSGDPTDVWVAGDGKVWFTMFDAGKVGFVDPSTGQVTEYANFAGKGPNAITVTPDGTAWVTLTYAHKLAKITSSGQITELTLSGNQHPIDITHTPDGKLWFTLFTSNKIGRYDPASAVTSFFTVPTGSAQPAGIAVAYDQVTGDPSRIYFTEYNSGKIGWFNLATPNSISEISVGSGTQPYAINLGPDGNIWFAQAGTNKVGRIVNGTILNYTLPAGTSPRGIDGGFTAADPSAGPWVAVTGYNSNEIVILRFDALFAVDDAYEVLQNGTTVPLDVLANDAQLTDQELTIVLVTSGSGTIEVAPDGKSLNYTPGTGFTGSDVFTYTIQDQHGHQDTSTVTVNVQYPGSIAGYVRIDTDGNGQVDANDQGVADRTVDLYRNNQLVATSTTQSDGSYSFIDLFPGTYTVQQQTPTGWTPTTTQTTAIVTSNLTTTTDLGTFQNLIVKGSKYNDIDQDGVWDPGENGLPGWTIQLYTTTGGQLSASPLQTITTDAHGDYSFDDLGPLPAGTSYVVVEVLPTGWIQTYPNASVLDTILLPDGTRGYVIDAASGVLLTAQNGSMQYVTGTGAVTLNGLNNNLTGIVSYNDGAGHAGSINAYLSQFNVTYSSSEGQITFDTFCIDLFHQVTVGQTYEVAVRSDLFLDVDDNGQPEYANGARMAYIFDRYGSQNLSGNSVQAAAVQLALWSLSLNNHIPTYFTQDPDGSYSNGDESIFEVQLSGSNAAAIAALTHQYILESLDATTKGGWFDASISGDEPNRGQSLLIPEAMRVFRNFQAATISGRKFNEASGISVGVPGWTIFLDEDGDNELDPGEVFTQTDSQGYYSFDVGIGTHHVREVQQPGWRQLSANPPGLVVTGPGQTYAGVDFHNFEDYLLPTTLVVEAGVVQGVEGSQASGLVAQFTSAQPGLSSIDFTATIDWGDGSFDPNATIQSNTLGGFDVIGSHTYSEGKSYLVKVTVSGPYGVQEVAYSTALIADAPLQLSGQTLPALNVGQSYQASLAILEDSDPDAASKTYQATVDWGDGTALETFTVNGSASPVDILRTHTYNQAGKFTVRVIVEDEGLKRAVALSQVDVTPVATTDDSLHLASQRVSATEGIELKDVIVALGGNLNPLIGADCHEATINWGDGTVTAGRILSTQLNNWQVVGTHTYEQQGNYLVTVTVHDDEGHSVVVRSTATVADQAFTTTVRNQVVARNTPFSNIVLGGIQDGYTRDPLANYTVEINWGDGTSSTSGLLGGSAGSFFVAGSHSYQFEGNYLATATIKGDGVTYATFYSPIAVGAVVEGASATETLATFYNSNPTNDAFSHDGIITWNDSTFSSITLGEVGGLQAVFATAPPQTFKVQTSHAWLQPGDYQVGVDINVDSAVAMSPSSFRPFRVADAPLVASAAATHVGIEGQEASGIHVASVTDTDLNLNSALSVTIDWGDGMQSGGNDVTLTFQGNGTFEITGNHEWRQKGTYTITVYIESQAGSTTLVTSQAVINDAPLAASPVDVAAFENVSTGPATVAHVVDSNPYGQPENLTGTIHWGDGDSSTASFKTDSQGNIIVVGTHVYIASGSYTVSTDIYYQGNFLDTVHSTATVYSGNFDSLQRGYDPERGYLLPIGEVDVTLNTGGLRLAHALDFDLSPGTSVGGSPALVYNSDTASARPIIELHYTPTDGSLPPPSSFEVELTFAGRTQTVQTFAANASNGNTYVMAVQVDQPLPGSGVYDWSANIKIHSTTGPTLSMAVSGEASVVVQDYGLGAGWGIAGVDRLVFGCGEILYVYGTGDSRIFTLDQNGDYLSMLEDWGTLVHNEGNPALYTDDTFTYTDKFQMTWNFNYQGLLTSMVDTHGLALTYMYDGQGRLMHVSSYDGGETSLAYSTGNVTISEPTTGAARTVQLTVSNNNLTRITDSGTDAAGTNHSQMRDFGYDGSHHLTSDKWQPLDATFTYDPGTGLLTNVNRGLGTTYQIASMSAAALQGQALIASVQDGKQHTTFYQLDERARMLRMDRPLGITELYARDVHGQLTEYTDPRGFKTTYTYDNSVTGKGDMVLVEYPDGGSVDYIYEPTFHNVVLETAHNVFNAVTTDQFTIYTYNAQGDLGTVTDALGNVTTYVWDDGLLQSMTDARDHTTIYEYDSNRRLQEVIDALGNPTFFTYDHHGNPLETTDALTRTSTTIYDSRNLLVRQIDALNHLTQWKYNAFGQLTEMIEPQTTTSDAITGSLITLDHVTQYQYDQRGFEFEMIEAVGTPAARKTTSTYDAAGNLASVTTGIAAYIVNNGVFNIATQHLSVTQFTYDDADRRETMTEAVNEPDSTRTTTMVYDKSGNLIFLENGRFVATAFEYDARNRQTQIFENWHLDPTGTVELYDRLTEMEYDTLGNLRSTTSGNRKLMQNGAPSTDGSHPTTTNYDYDLLNRAISTTEAVGTDDVRTTAQEYDAVGNIITSTDARGTVSRFDFDELDRLIRIYENWRLEPLPPGEQGPPAPAWDRLSTMQYDAVGNLLFQVDPRGFITTYAHDALDRVVGVAENFVAGAPITIAGVTIQGTFDRLTLTDYDALGNPTNVQTGFTLNPSIFGHVNQTLYHYDALSRTVAITEAWFQPEERITTMAYDAADNLVGVTAGIALRNPDQRYQHKTVSAFQYDALNRRTFAQAGNANTGTVDRSIQRWTYDKADNVATSVEVSSLSSTSTITTSYLYDALDRPISVVEALGTAVQRQSTMTYDGAGNLRSMTSGIAAANAKVVVNNYEYDFLNRQKVITQAANVILDTRVATISYDGNDNITYVTNPRGFTTHTEYDRLNQKTAVYENWIGTPVGPVYDRLTTFLYDPAGNLLATTAGLTGNASIQAAPVTTSFQYDGLGRQTKIIEAFGVHAVERTTDLTYDSVDNLRKVVSGQANPNNPNFALYHHPTTTEFLYDKLNRRNYVKEAVGTDERRDSSLLHDAADNLIETTTGISGDADYAHQATTKMAYDALNRRLAVTDAENHTTTTAYDGFGNLNVSEDALGNKTTQTYDALHRAFLTQEPELLYFNGTHLPSGIIPTTTLLYDSQDNVIRTEVEQIYKVYGEQQSRTLITTYVYDSHRNRKVTTDAKGQITSTTYDKNNNLETVEDPLHNITTYTYTPLDQQETIQQSVSLKLGANDQPEPAISVTTTFGYDALGRRTESIDHNNRRSKFEYDELGRLKLESWFADASVTESLNNFVFEYDAAGNLRHTYNLGTDVQTSFEYLYQHDALNRLKHSNLFFPGSTPPATAQVTYHYDAANNVTRRDDLFSNVASFVTSVYDKMNLLKDRTWTYAGAELGHVVMDYTARNQLHSINRFNNGFHRGATVFAYDNSGRVIIQTDSVPRSPTDPFHPLNNTVVLYDSTGLVRAELNESYRTDTQYDHIGSASIYDKVGQLEESHSFAYQLVPGGINQQALSSTTYAYDANGNRLQTTTITNQTETGPTSIFGAGNRLLKDKDWAYEYDKEGNLVKRTSTSSNVVWTFEYDHRNRVSKLTKTGDPDPTKNGTIAYLYDGLGNRLQTNIVNGAGQVEVTRFIYDGKEVIADLKPNAGGTSFDVQTYYLRGNQVDQLLGRVEPGFVPTWAVTDRQGTIRYLLRSGVQFGEQLLRLDYTAWGQAIPAFASPLAPGRYSFTGREYDAESGLTYYRARYYDTQSGRWTSQDPLGLGPDVNPYRYLGNSPGNGTDPDGLFWREAWDFASRMPMAFARTTTNIAAGFGYGFLGLLQLPGELYKTTTEVAPKVGSDVWEAIRHRLSIAGNRLFGTEVYQPQYQSTGEDRRRIIETLTSGVPSLVEQVSHAGSELWRGNTAPTEFLLGGLAFGYATGKFAANVLPRKSIAANRLSRYANETRALGKNPFRSTSYSPYSSTVAARRLQEYSARTQGNLFDSSVRSLQSEAATAKSTGLLALESTLQRLYAGKTPIERARILVREAAKLAPETVPGESAWQTLQKGRAKVKIDSSDIASFDFELINDLGEVAHVIKLHPRLFEQAIGYQLKTALHEIGHAQQFARLSRTTPGFGWAAARVWQNAILDKSFYAANEIATESLALEALQRRGISSPGLSLQSTRYTGAYAKELYYYLNAGMAAPTKAARYAGLRGYDLIEMWLKSAEANTMLGR